MTIEVEFITKTKLPYEDPVTERIATMTYELHERVELPDDAAGFVIGNGWAKRVSDDA